MRWTPAQLKVLDAWKADLPKILAGERVTYPPPEVSDLLYTMAEVLAAVARTTGLSAEAIRGKRRTEKMCGARHLAVLLICDLCPEKSLTQIGRFLNRDHTTIIHGRKAALRRLDHDPAFRQAYDKTMGAL